MNETDLGYNPYAYHRNARIAEVPVEYEYSDRTALEVAKDLGRSTMHVVTGANLAPPPREPDYSPLGQYTDELDNRW